MLSLPEASRENVLFLPCASGMREKMSLLGTWGLVEELSEGYRSIWVMLGWAGRWTASQFTERSCVRVLCLPYSPRHLQKFPLLFVSLSYIVICDSFVVCPFPGKVP